MRAGHTIEAAAREVVLALKNARHEAYWAGGCVRDQLLGRKPADIDVATDATPDQICALFRKTRKVGATPSSWRPPWLEITNASAPRSTERLASSAV